MGLGNFLGMGSGAVDKKINNFVYVGDTKKVPSKMDVPVITDDNPFLVGNFYQHVSKFNDLYHFTRVYDNILNYRSLYRDSYEAFFAVNEIKNEAVVVSNNTKNDNVEIDLSSFIGHDLIAEAVRDSFSSILYLLNWKQNGQDIFLKWYIDGRRYFYPIIPDEHPTVGIQEIKILSPFYVMPYYDNAESDEAGADQYDEFKSFKRYWKLRDQRGQLYKVDDDLLICGDSGFYDPETGEALSYLELCQKHYNRLDLIENSAIIYRVVRAPERRVFYVQIRKTPRNKAKAQVKDLIRAYSNNTIFDGSFNRIDSKKAYISMTNDIWLTEDDQGKGTKVETLPGGTQVGEVTDLELFKRNYIRSLNIPISSYFDQGGLNFSMGSQITEERKRFFDYISSLRNQFCNIFYDLMELDLCAKRVINHDEWDEIKSQINFKWESSSHFNDLKELEVLQSKADVIDRFDVYVGKYFDDVFIYEEILGWSDDKIAEMKNRVMVYNKQNPDAEGGDGGSGGGGGSLGGGENLGEPLLPDEGGEEQPLDNEPFADEEEPPATDVAAPEEEI